MIIRDKIISQLSPEDIWPAVADPAVIRQWRPEITKLERFNTGPVINGETFIVMTQNQGQVMIDVTVEKLREFRRVAYRCHRRDWPSGAAYIERYILQPRREGGTRVFCIDDFRATPMPRIARACIRLLSIGSATHGGAMRQHLERTRRRLRRDERHSERL
jgi:uncharacterized protein YndB with AHSA1/START domain